MGDVVTKTVTTKGLFGMALELNSNNSNLFSTLNSKTLWSCQLHGAVVQIEAEFWRTSCDAPIPPNTNLGVELVDNYPPIQLVT
jgi:hypothetical protein